MKRIRSSRLVAACLALAVISPTLMGGACAGAIAGAQAAARRGRADELALVERKPAAQCAPLASATAEDESHLRWEVADDARVNTLHVTSKTAVGWTGTGYQCPEQSK